VKGRERSRPFVVGPGISAALDLVSTTLDRRLALPARRSTGAALDRRGALPARLDRRGV